MRSTINARQPRTLQDATRDAYDYLVGPDGETGQRAAERWRQNLPMSYWAGDVALYVVAVVAFLAVGIWLIR